MRLGLRCVHESGTRSSSQATDYSAQPRLGKEMPPASFTTSDGAHISYCFDGRDDARVIVLSNSLGTGTEMWRAQMPRFARNFRVLRYDSRGHSRSSKPHGEYSIGRLGQDVVELLQYVGVVRAAYCGLSMGGMVGQWLGANAPERISQLVLCNTSAYTGPEAWRARIDAICSGGMQSIADPVLARWFTPEFSERQPAAVFRLREMLLSQLPQGYIGCCAAIRDMDLRASAPAISIPTLVIGGTEDQATPPSDSEWLASAIPGASLAMLRAAHLSNIELSDEFTALVIGFLIRGHPYRNHGCVHDF